MAELQNIIAICYDFDLTLSPHYMQEPIFKKFGIDTHAFFKETDDIVDEARTKGVCYDKDCSYMNFMLRYVRDGRLSGLNNAMLREIGQEIELYPGLPDYFTRIKDIVRSEEKYKRYGINVEHYVISTGLKEMVLGNAVGQYIDGVFASEFYEIDGVIAEIARTVGHAKKTEFLHLINKGGNVDTRIDVNSLFPKEFRRVPFEQMIYIGDGPTDVPCLAMMKHRNGKGIAVYGPKEKSFKQAFQLQQDERVLAFAPADYSSGSHLSNILESVVREMADKIVLRRETELVGRIRQAPQL